MGRYGLPRYDECVLTYFSLGQMNFALYHCLGPSIQTALFNGPLVVLVGWALGKPMDLNFEIFMIALLVAVHTGCW